MVGVGEHLQVAGELEVDLRGEESGAGDPLLANRRQVGEGDRKQRSTDAIARRVHSPFAGRLLDHVERCEDALGHVVLEALLRLPGVRIDPGDHEDGVALGYQPADQRLLRCRDRGHRTC